MPSSLSRSDQNLTFTPAHRVQSFGQTVFAEFTALAIEHDAVNLGQGFPNFAAPDFVKEAAQEAIARDLNQYARSAGHPRLVNAIADVYSPLFGRRLDPLQEIVVTVGATEGIFATIQALVNPGDEVILIEPFYDSYPASVIMAGGKPVYVPVATGRPTLRPVRPNGDLTSMNWQRPSAPRPSDRHQHAAQPGRQALLSRGLEQIAALVQEHDITRPER